MQKREKHDYGVCGNVLLVRKYILFNKHKLFDIYTDTAAVNLDVVSINRDYVQCGYVCSIKRHDG